jgi:hypothetical protein
LVVTCCPPMIQVPCKPSGMDSTQP